MTDNDNQNRTPPTAPAWLKQWFEDVKWLEQWLEDVNLLPEQYRLAKPQPAELPPVPVLRPMPEAPRDGSFILIQHVLRWWENDADEITVSLCQWNDDAGKWMHSSADELGYLPDKYAHGWIPMPVNPPEPK